MPVMCCKKSLAYILPFSSSAVSILAFIFTCALDVRKCLALASLFACGLLHGRVRHAMRGCNYVAKVPRRKKNNSFAVIFVVRPQGLEPWTH